MLEIALREKLESLLGGEWSVTPLFAPQRTTASPAREVVYALLNYEPGRAYSGREQLQRPLYRIEIRAKNYSDLVLASDAILSIDNKRQIWKDVEIEGVFANFVGDASFPAPNGSDHPTLTRAIMLEIIWRNPSGSN